MNLAASPCQLGKKMSDDYYETAKAAQAVLDQASTIMSMRTEGAMRVAAYHARLRAMGIEAYVPKNRLDRWLRCGGTIKGFEMAHPGIGLTKQ